MTRREERDGVKDRGSWTGAERKARFAEADEARGARHLSRFMIGGHPWRGAEVDMATSAGRVFRPGVEHTHVYDFGTSTVTAISLVGQRQGKPTSRWPLTLVARKDPPRFECQVCGRSGRWFCEECFYEDRPGLLCTEHEEEGHAHDPEGLLPVVNSPRWGQCGYTGSAEPPF